MARIFKDSGGGGVQSLSHLWLLATPQIAERPTSLSFTISQSLLKLMSIGSVMPSNHLILCHPLLLLPSVFPNIRVFSNESALCIRWPKDWSFSFSIPLLYFPSEIAVSPVTVKAYEMQHRRNPG